MADPETSTSSNSGTFSFVANVVRPVDLCSDTSDDKSEVEVEVKDKSRSKGTRKAKAKKMVTKKRPRVILSGSSSSNPDDKSEPDSKRNRPSTQEVESPIDNRNGEGSPQGEEAEDATEDGGEESSQGEEAEDATEDDGEKSPQGEEAEDATEDEEEAILCEDSCQDSGSDVEDLTLPTRTYNRYMNDAATASGAGGKGEEYTWESYDDDDEDANEKPVETDEPLVPLAGSPGDLDISHSAKFISPAVQTRWLRELTCESAPFVPRLSKGRVNEETGRAPFDKINPILFKWYVDQTDRGTPWTTTPYYAFNCDHLNILKPEPVSETLEKIMRHTEVKLGLPPFHFNAALVQYMSPESVLPSRANLDPWIPDHSNVATAFITIGAERTICMKRNSKMLGSSAADNKISVKMSSGSILCTTGACQQRWKYEVGKITAKQAKDPNHNHNHLIIMLQHIDPSLVEWQHKAREHNLSWDTLFVNKQRESSQSATAAAVAANVFEFVE